MNIPQYASYGFKVDVNIRATLSPKCGEVKGKITSTLAGWGPMSSLSNFSPFKTKIRSYVTISWGYFPYHLKDPTGRYLFKNGNIWDILDAHVIIPPRLSSSSVPMCPNTGSHQPCVRAVWGRWSRRRNPKRWNLVKHQGPPVKSNI